VGDRGWFRPRISSKRVGCLGDRRVLGLQVSRSIGSRCRAMQSCDLASLEPLDLFPALATLPLDPGSFKYWGIRLSRWQNGESMKSSRVLLPAPLMLLIGMHELFTSPCCFRMPPLVYCGIVPERRLSLKESCACRSLAFLEQW
jgi:hypothetical protein